MTLCITKNDIPDYLKESELYDNIDSDDPFDIPIELFKEEIIINTLNDLIIYIKIFDYWMIKKIPNDFYDWVFINKEKIDMNLLNNIFDKNYLIKQFECIKSDYICSSLAENGYLDCLKYAHENGYKLDDDICYLAAKNGHLDCLKYAHDNNCLLNNKTCIIAVENGHLDCLIYIYKNGCKLDKKVCANIAACEGHLDCLKYIHTAKNIYNDSDSDSDSDDIIKDYILSFDKNICCNTIKYGRLECLKYVHENGCPWDSYEYCELSALYGQLECLKYLHENGCPWNEKTCIAAASKGHLECLKYAHENDCLWNAETCSVAAEKGHLECLKYAHENDCSWFTEKICYIAASNGHLECLKYAHENGCLLSDDIIKIVTKNGYLDCLKYVYENTHSLDIKIKKKHKCLEYAKQNGIEWNEFMCYFFENNKCSCLNYKPKENESFIIKNKYLKLFDNILIILKHNVTITKLIFDEDFNQPLDNLPNTITHLSFSKYSKFNYPLDNLPNSITYLEFGSHFNHPLNNLPNTITHLTIGSKFNHPLNNLPNTITHLSFSKYSKFNQLVDNLPKSLTHLEFGYHFNQSINNLSNTITHLTFNSAPQNRNDINFNHKYEILLVRMASIGNFTILKKFINLSKNIGIAKYIVENKYIWDLSLTTLIINKGDWYAYNIYQNYGCPKINNKNFINLTNVDIPEYLKESKLYDVINIYGSIDIPKEFFKKKLIIKCDNDLINYIQILNYWIIKRIPIKIYNYVFNNKKDIDMEKLNKTFGKNYLINEIQMIINHVNKFEIDSDGIHIEFDGEFNHPVDKLPNTITHLTIGEHDSKFNQELGKLPNSITHFIFNDSYGNESKFNKKIYNLPENLWYLEYTGYNFKIREYCELNINIDDDNNKIYDCYISIIDFDNKFINNLLNYLKGLNKKYLHINIEFGYYDEELCGGHPFYISGIKKIYFDNHIHEYKYKDTNKIIDYYDIQKIYEDYIIEMIRNIYKINFNSIECKGSRR